MTSGRKKTRLREHPCKGCVHWYGAYPYGISCNYIFDTGHRRPCEPGENCTVRETAPEGSGEGSRASWDLL